MERKHFEHPEKVKSLGEAQAPLWFWNDKLEKEELLRQLEQMSAKGVTCNAPHARTGFEGDYLDEEWMEHIRTVVDYKKKNNETMWLYDEFNWPAGIANGEVTKDENFREKYLYIRRFDVPANTRFRCQPEKLREKKIDAKASITTDSKQKLHIDNLFVYDAETMEKLDITQFQPDDHSGQLFNLSGFDFEVQRDRATVVFQAKVLTERFNKEGFYDPDYLNRKATEKFVDITYEPYYKEFPDAFGEVITASFNDETRFCHALPWTDDLPDIFEERYGYPIEEHLPELILPGKEAGRVRCDYFNLIADLYRDCFHGVIRKWCEDHKIDYCPHLLGEETMAGQVRYSGDFMRQLREVTRPGVDHLGKGIGSLNIRFASSAAELYGKKGLACEVFAASGWELTFEEYIRMISWLFSQGVETITNHGFFYSIRDFRKEDWPPSQFFQWKGWERMAEGNAMCRRLYGMAEESRRKTDVLIYHPVETFWMHYIPDQQFTHGFHMGPIIQSQRAAEIDRNEQILLNTLQENNRDFTAFISDATDQFYVENGKLLNKNSGQSYEIFILPMCEVIPLETAELLEQFVSQGGKLLIMESVPEYSMKKEQDEKVRDIFVRIKNLPGTTIVNDMEASSALKWLDENSPQKLRIIEGISGCKKTALHYPDWIIDPYIHTGEDMQGITWTHFQGKTDAYYFVNYTDEQQELTIEVESKIKPEIWDTLTGEINAAEIVKADEEAGVYQVKLTLNANYGVFLVTGKEEE